MQDMERRVWGGEDIDVSPVLLMVALVKSGALLLGAFLDGRMRGFAFSVPGDRHGHRLHWSHMTGVDEALRSSGLGTLLEAGTGAARGGPRLLAHPVDLRPPAEPQRAPQPGEARRECRRVRRARVRRFDERPASRRADRSLHRDVVARRGRRAGAIAAPGSRRRDRKASRAGTVSDAGRLGRLPRGRGAADGAGHPRARCRPDSRPCCRRRRTWPWRGACRRARSSRRSLPPATKRSRSAAPANAATTSS